MKLHTASEAINFTEKLENESAKFYEDLTLKYPQGKDIFLSFAKENAKNVQQVKRTYYEVITDALEGCFAFEMDSDAYQLSTSLAESSTYADSLKLAIELEEKITKFYAEAAEQSKALMADVPRAFAIVARKRGDRIAKLRALLDQKNAPL